MHNVDIIISECVNDFIMEAKENVDEEKYQIWKGKFDESLADMIDILQSDYLDALNLHIVINEEYAFGGGKSHWLAAYERASKKILQGIVSIGINYPLLYSKMKKMGIDEDNFNIEAQARITPGHEVGHALVDFVRVHQQELYKCDNNDVLYMLHCNKKQEEEIVEEFGESMFPDATGVYGSKIGDAFEYLSDVFSK